MHDIKWIRDHPVAFDAALARRGLAPVSEQLLSLDEERRGALTQVQDDQARRNEASRQIGQIKRDGGDASALMDEVATLKARMAVREEEARQLEDALTRQLLSLPNLPAEAAPDGQDEDDNVELRRVGEPRRFDFEPLEHDALGAQLGQMDQERAARMAGSRFTVLTGGLARLERAIGQFMIDIQTRDHGYTEAAVPFLVWDKALIGTGQLPKFGEDLFRCGEHHLIPTAEVPLSNLHREEILEEDSLPRRYTALTPCFRAEAGAAGRDVGGMIRQHQFHKVELVSITTPEQAADEHARMLTCAEEILRQLDLAYRVMDLCTGDLGASMKRTFDIEVWLPGQGRYREISSCSWAGDWQARRMRLRCRPKGEKATRFCHTLNGSGLAVGRTLIAVMETYQQADGTIAVPEPLQPYLGGDTVIR
ncbi:MAG: serine--tRNA ligase [Rhodothalassiaceae bacterium]